MIHVKLPDNTQRRLVFYLAMEEWLAHICSTDKEYFFLWQTTPTVIYGRNQDVEAEVNLDYCRQKAIEIYRRKSGGGCVYSDSGNLMLSFIVSDTNVCDVFARYLDSLAKVLRCLGFDAVKTEHNDVLINGSKVSGNAFYALPQSSIVHGTLLYDVDFSELMNAITPSREKLESHGVKSVRQRVVNIKEINPDVTLDTIKEHLLAYFCNEELILSSSDVTEIEEIEKEYLI